MAQICIPESKYSEQNRGGREGKASEASTGVSFIFEDSLLLDFENFQVSTFPSFQRSISYFLFLFII